MSVKADNWSLSVPEVKILDKNFASELLSV